MPFQKWLTWWYKASTFCFSQTDDQIDQWLEVSLDEHIHNDAEQVIYYCEILWSAWFWKVLLSVPWTDQGSQSDLSDPPAVIFLQGRRGWVAGWCLLRQCTMVWNLELVFCRQFLQQFLLETSVIIVPQVINGPRQRTRLCWKLRVGRIR